MTDRQAAITAMLPCPAVILTAAAGERRDAMTATAFFVSEVPPLLSVSVAGHHLTSELIEQTGEFTVNLATPEQVEMVWRVGSTHGRELDKFKEFGIATEPSQLVGAPRIVGSYVSLECKVVGSHAAASYRVYVAEVLTHVADEQKSPLLWHRGHFLSLGDPVG